MMRHSLITILIILAMSRDCSPTEGIGVRVGLYLFVLFIVHLAAVIQIHIFYYSFNILSRMRQVAGKHTLQFSYSGKVLRNHNT